MAALPIPEAPTHGAAITANWGRRVVECLRRLSPVAGQGMRLDLTPNGTVYSSQPAVRTAGVEAAAELKPFDIRWYPYGGDADSGEWQIYLPLGCVTLKMRTVEPTEYPCLCDGEAAKDGRGEEIYGWCRIEEPDESDGQTVKIGDTVYVSVPVYVLLKPWPRFKVSTDPEANGAVLQRTVVGTVNIAKVGDDVTLRTGRRAGVESVAASDSSGDYRFNVVYRFDDGDLYKKGATPKTLVVDLEFAGGRTVVISDEATVDVSEWSEVWLKIDHDVEKAEDMAISLVQEGERNSLTQTLVQLYELKDGVVVKDKRSSLDKIRFYDS